MFVVTPFFARTPGFVVSTSASSGRALSNHERLNHSPFDGAQDERIGRTDTAAALPTRGDRMLPGSLGLCGPSRRIQRPAPSRRQFHRRREAGPIDLGLAEFLSRRCLPGFHRSLPRIPFRNRRRADEARSPRLSPWARILGAPVTEAGRQAGRKQVHRVPVEIQPPRESRTRAAIRWGGLRQTIAPETSIVPGRQTRPRSLRTTSTIITFSARSLELFRRASAMAASSSGRRRRGPRAFDRSGLHQPVRLAQEQLGRDADDFDVAAAQIS